MDIIQDILSNRIFLVAAAGWAVAQILKTLITLAITKSFDPERLFGSGGMPSSHSSTVCALATAVTMQYGAASFEFAISAILAIVVMYDAAGVRREAGTQAAVLNHFIEMFAHMDSIDEPQFTQEKLKELIGHTPLQVFAGAVLGILIAVFLYPTLL